MVSADWQSRGACVGHADLFHAADHFAADGSPMQEPKIVRMQREWLADQLCASCPVIAQCRTYALTYEETYGTPISGFWARMNQADIKRIAAGGKATPKLDPDAPAPRRGPKPKKPRPPVKERKPKGPPRGECQHGTVQGYYWHTRHRIPACPECVAVFAAHQRKYRAQRRQKGLT